MSERTNDRSGNRTRGTAVECRVLVARDHVEPPCEPSRPGDRGESRTARNAGPDSIRRDSSSRNRPRYRNGRADQNRRRARTLVRRTGRRPSPAGVNSSGPSLPTLYGRASARFLVHSHGSRGSYGFMGVSVLDKGTALKTDFLKNVERAAGENHWRVSG